MMIADAPPTPTAYVIKVQDVEYRRVGDHALMATLYLPQGAGPFAAVLEVHGGAWTGRDRFNNKDTATTMARAGIIVMSIDFRMPPEAPYPASLQDINLAIRWLKAHARDFGGSPERVGAYGTSSGGHQVLLTAMRPADPRYAALPLPSAPGLDATLAFVISGWGVLDPHARYALARRLGKQDVIRSHDAFWGDEAAMSEGDPLQILERKEHVRLPPAFVFQGTEDEWTSPAQAEHFASMYRAAGGELELALFEGERHTFVNENPTSPNTRKAVEAMIAFANRFAR
jgi:acetyl esterase/lipase